METTGAKAGSLCPTPPVFRLAQRSKAPGLHPHASPTLHPRSASRSPRSLHPLLRGGPPLTSIYSQLPSFTLNQPPAHPVHPSPSISTVSSLNTQRGRKDEGGNVPRDHVRGCSLVSLLTHSRFGVGSDQPPPLVSEPLTGILQRFQDTSKVPILPYICLDRSGASARKLESGQNDLRIPHRAHKRDRSESSGCINTLGAVNVINSILLNHPIRFHPILNPQCGAGGPCSVLPRTVVASRTALAARRRVLYGAREDGRGSIHQREA